MNKHQPPHDAVIPIITQIRRELYLMMISGLMISILITWATSGLFPSPLIIRFGISALCVIALNILAYIVKSKRLAK